MLQPHNRSNQPEPRSRRVVAEMAGGFLFGLGGGILGGMIGTVIGGNLYGPSGGEAFAGLYGYEATGWVGLIIGVIIGGATGVYWAGRGVHRIVSFVATLSASIVAVLIGAALLMATGEVAREDWLLNKHRLTLPILFLMTLTGGVLGCELTRRSKAPTDGLPSTPPDRND